VRGIVSGFTLTLALSRQGRGKNKQSWESVLLTSKQKMCWTGIDT